jgi:branched-chain amino acid transport system permease protein
MSVTQAPPAAAAHQAQRRRGSTALRHLAVVGAAAVLLLGLTYVLGPFRNYQLATGAAYVCALAGLNLLTGLSGQISLGHGALMAVGAYGVALTQGVFDDRGVTAPWTLPVAVVAGILAAIVAGALLGVAAARLRGPYLAGVTLALAVSVPALTTTFDGVFGGDQGLSFFVAPPPLALGAAFPVERWQAWLAVAAALVTLWFLANLVRSRVGRTLRAVRDDDVAAELAGVHVSRVRVLAFVISAASAGLGGAVLALLAQTVSPGSFGLTLSLNLLLAVVLGGLGRLAGALWGALALVVLPSLASTVADAAPLSTAAAQRLEGTLPLALFGLALIVVMTTAPDGIDGAVRRLLARVRRTSGTTERKDVP